MQKGYICVAGIDLDTNRHVRPVLHGERLRVTLLSRNGGPFDMACIVDLGKTSHAGNPPEVEDYLFSLEGAHQTGSMNSKEFWGLLKAFAKPTLLDIFGKDLKQRGPTSCAVDVGKGTTSLGCFVPKSTPKIYLRSRNGGPAQIRMEVTDGQFALDLGVTDIRLYDNDHVTPVSKTTNNVADRLRKGIGVILSMGLTRPFPRESPVHWLQVNNIHLEDNPAWRLG